MANLKHREALLADIVQGLKRMDLTGEERLGTFEVVFHDASYDGEFTFSVIAALDAVSKDLYFDERGNWSESEVAEVRYI